MIRKILQTVADRLPARDILDNGQLYMIRHYVGTVFGWRIYLHHFVGSDPDRGLHDHPWRRSFSFILAGWYWEHTRFGLRKVKWFNHLTGDSFHRVELPKGETCWTLFIHTTGDVKEWGFLTGHPDVTSGEKIFVPYKYPGGKKMASWWVGAPKGREIRNKLLRVEKSS